MKNELVLWLKKVGSTYLNEVKMRKVLLYKRDKIIKAEFHEALSVNRKSACRIMRKSMSISVIINS
jgi:hypothetical protein